MPGEAPFLQRKTFLRSFVKRVEINPKSVVVDYTIPLPLKKRELPPGKSYVLTKLVAGVGFEPTTSGL